MYVIIRGGLGNQMFQVAFAIALSEKFCLTPKYINFSSKARVARSWSLSCFGIEPEPIGIIHNFILYAAILLARKNPFASISEFMGTVIEHEDFSSPQLYSKPPKLIEGYWQGISFFANHENKVREKFKFPIIPSKWKLETFEIDRSHVAIHVRRGDYVTDLVARSSHLVCDVVWYQSAWEILRERVHNCRALVFSDDPDWACANLNLIGDVEYVKSEPSQPAWIDMARMAQCNHFIISNSTYSWWSAYLSTSPGKVVIAPRYWFRGVETEHLNICPKSWVLL